MAAMRNQYNFGHRITTALATANVRVPRQAVVFLFANSPTSRVIGKGMALEGHALATVKLQMLSGGELTKSAPKPQQKGEGT